MRRTTSARLSRVCGLAAAIGLAVPAAAQPEDDDVQPERVGMPPGIPAVRTSPGFSLHTDTNFMTQVNVTALGLNILGDAANEPSIAIDPTAPNRIVMGWRQFNTVASNFRQAGWAWSDDGGRTWHFPGVLTPGVFRSDPVLESDFVGNFYYYTLPDSAVGGWRCELFKSFDGGRTWGLPVLANGGDRAWMAIDKSGDIGTGHIYGDWNAAFSCCGTGNFGRDTSQGTLLWPPAITAPNNPGRSTLAVGPAGELFFVGSGGLGVRIMRSDNARNAAQTPSFALTTSVSLGGTALPGFPGNPGGASGQVWVDVNRSNGPNRGHVYVLTHAGPIAGDPSDVRFIRSTDNGLTWSAPVRVNDDPPGASSWQWFCSMSVAPNGRIDATWNDTRNTLTTTSSQLFYSCSLDEGRTWTPNVALTPTFNTMVGWPQQNKIGDYYDQESDDVGLFIAMAATFNNEQDVYFIRVNDWDCNKNGVPDAQDLAAGLLHDCNLNGVPDECEAAAGVTVVCACYPNCDASTAAPVLNVADFSCFLNRFAAGDSYANCDGSTTAPVLNVADFSCFLNAFAAGCS